MAVVVGRFDPSGRGLAPSSSLERWLPFDPATHWDSSMAGSAVDVWSWGAPVDRAPIPIGDRILVVDGFTTDEPARLVSVLFASSPPELAAFGGAFAAIGIDRDHLVAYSTPSADHPLYWAAVDGIALVSNRPGLVAGMTGAHVDPATCMALADEGFFSGGYALFRGVRQLLPGQRLRVTGRHGVLSCTVDEPNWQPLFDTSGQPHRVVAERLNAALDVAVEGVRRLPVGVQLKLPLSGGKDSRAVAAIIEAAGRLDDVGEFRTDGASFAPEVLAARAVTAALGVTHRHRVVAPRMQFEPGDVGGAVLATLAARGSALSLFNPAGDHLVPGQITLSGHEVGLKATGFSKFPRDDFAEFLRQATEERCDPAKIFTTEARGELISRRREQLAELGRRGVPIDRMPIFINWYERGGGWTGNTLVAHRAANCHYNPLMDSAIMTLALSLPRVCSDGELILYSLMSRGATGLSRLPFAESAWPAELRAALSVVGERDRPPVVPSLEMPRIVRQRFRPWNTPMRAVTLRSLRPTLLEMAHGHRDVIPYIDLQALDDRLRGLGEAGTGRSLSDIALLGLGSILVSAEYGPDLFDRHRRPALAESLAGRLEPIRGIDSEAGIIEIHRHEIQTRDEVIAAFCQQEQQRRRRWEDAPFIFRKVLDIRRRILSRRGRRHEST